MALERTRPLRRLALIATLVVALAAAGFFAWRTWRRAGASADIAPLVPADVESLAFIPRLDGAIDEVLRFGRGTQESGHLRDLFKAEANADIGTPEGLRAIGLDPEGAVAVYRRGGLFVVLASVEDTEKVEAALSAKLTNLGYKGVTATEPDASGKRAWQAVDASGAVSAAFVAHGGVLAIATGKGAADPLAGARAAAEAPEKAFFGSGADLAIQKALPGEGILLYQSLAPWLLGADGTLRPELLSGLVLPPMVQSAVKPWLERWLQSVQNVAVRVAVEPCSTSLSLHLDTNDSQPLLPKEWLAERSPAPDFGRLLPRDTVLLARVALDVQAITTPIVSLAKVGAAVNQLVGDGTDPVATALGTYVHKDLADKDVLDDLVAHLSGHVMVALLGIDKKAPFEALADLSSPERWFAQVHAAVGFGLLDGKRFIEKWAPKRTVLTTLGFEVADVPHPEWLVWKLERNCKPPPPPPPPPPGKKAPPPPPPKQCERYGLLATPTALIVTSGGAALDRVLAAATGAQPNLRSLTRETLAAEILEHGPETIGLYFSFDGLLRTVSNRNLPGGATRYLAQFFELALGVGVQGGDVSARLLLTR